MRQTNSSIHCYDSQTHRNMKNYLVIGGSSGIGKALVEKLQNKGENVIATYHQNAQTDRENVSYHQLDVVNGALNMDALPEVIDGLCYCPGSINLKPFSRFKEEDLMDDFKLQVVGATKIIKQCLPRLKKSDKGSIVLFSTIAVQSGFPFHAQVSISKGAIEGLTRSLAAEFAPQIRVNAIAPSLTDTPLAGKLLSTEEKKENLAAKNPLKRIGQAEDVAEAALYLLTEKSSWVTGQVMKVDGGYSVLK